MYFSLHLVKVSIFLSYKDLKEQDCRMPGSTITSLSLVSVIPLTLTVHFILSLR